MENNNKEPSQPEEKKEPKTEQTKQQRKLKFKTLDGKMTNLECDYNIKIIDLKKKLQEIYKIEPNRQRLLNKGKQFKDEETLDKYVDKDDTIIHLVFRSESDVKESQEKANQDNNARNNTNNANPQNQGANPIQNIFSMILNSDDLRNLTNNVVNQFMGQNQNQQNQNNTQNNNTANVTSSTNATINIGNSQYHPLNLTESLNLANSPLHPSTGSPNLTNPPSQLNLNNPPIPIPVPNLQSQIPNTQNSNPNPSNPNNYSSQFPIQSSERDKKYDIHLKKIDEELNSVDEIMSNKIEPRIPLPLLNTTQNVFTAISRQIRKYVIVNQNMLCHLMRLADLMEREQFITNSETRMVGNKLLDQAYKALAHTSKASQDLSNVIKSSNFNTAPNMGYIGVVCQEIGVQSTSIPINVADLNLNNADLNLDNLINSGNNSGNNNNPLGNIGNIVLRAINNNANNNQQGQGNQPDITAAIPINVDVNISSSNENNSNQNISTTHQTISINASSNNTNNNDQTNINQEKKEEKKENEVNTQETKTEEKKEEKEKETSDKLDNNNQNNNTNKQTNAPNQNQNQNQNPEVNFGNIFGSVMNQIMQPQNLNSLAGAMGSLFNNSNNSNSNNNNSGNANPMGMFGNIIQNLMGSLGDDSEEDEELNASPNQNQTSQNSNNENKSTPINEQNIKSEKDNLIQKLVDSPQLRRETKLNDEEKIGEKIEPNIEFASVSNEIISNLTVQDIFDMYNLRFKGISRLRKNIKEKYFKEKEKSEEILNKVVEILCQRFILQENQIDKLNPNKEFNMDEFFTQHIKKIFDLFISDELFNKSDEEWEEQLHQIVVKMFKELIEQLKNIYESGEDGAKFCIEFNITALIENLVGQKYSEKIQKYDENILNNFVENIFIIVKTEQIKEETSQKEDKGKPPLLTIDEIFKIAMKDKERLEKEEKEEKERGEEQDKKKYSDFYYMTSLFKK